MKTFFLLLILLNFSFALEDINKLINFANTAIEKKDFNKASEYLKKAHALDNNNLNIMYNLSSILLKIGDFSACEKLLENKDLDEKLKNNLIFAYYFNKNYAKILQISQSIKNPNNEILKIFFDSSMKLKKYDVAIKYFEKIYTNKDEKYYISLANMSEKANDKQKAINILNYAFEKKLLSDKNHIEYYLYLLEDLGLFNKAYSVAKMYNMGENILLNYCFLSHNLKEAKKILKSKNKPDYLLKLAKIYYNEQDYKNVINILNKKHFVKNSSLEGETFLLLFMTHYQMKNYTLSKENLHKAKNNLYTKKRAEELLKKYF